MVLISNYYTFFWRTVSPVHDLQKWLDCDYVMDTFRPNDDKSTIDDTCVLHRLSLGDKFLYSISSQDGHYYSDVIDTCYDLEAIQKDIRIKYVNMFNLVKLLQNVHKKQKS